MRYKIFYKDNVVAEFDIIYNAIKYIIDTIDNDKELDRKDFVIYERTGLFIGGLNEENSK